MFESIVRNMAAVLFVLSALFLASVMSVGGALLGAASGALSWWILDTLAPSVLILLTLGPAQLTIGGAFLGAVATLCLMVRFFVNSAKESEDANLRALAARIESSAKCLLPF